MPDNKKKDQHQYTADIEKLEKELAEFQRQWEQEKKKGLENIEKKDQHQYTADIEKLEKELAEFQRQWEQEKKKGLENIEKIENKIDKK